jgi:hypothetical protein
VLIARSSAAATVHSSTKNSLQLNAAGASVGHRRCTDQRRAHGHAGRPGAGHQASAARHSKWQVHRPSPGADVAAVMPCHAYAQRDRRIYGGHPGWQRPMPVAIGRSSSISYAVAWGYRAAAGYGRGDTTPHVPVRRVLEQKFDHSNGGVCGAGRER